MAEAATVGLGGNTCGAAMGMIMTIYVVTILRPRFILATRVTIAPASAASRLGSVLAATLVTALAAPSMASRLRPADLLVGDR